MIERLIVEEHRLGKPDREEALLIAHAESIGLPVERMTWKPFLRKRVSPAPGDVVSGSVAFVRAALQSLGRQLPRPDPYPDDLDGFLYRRVWKGGELAKVLAEHDANSRPVFIKPERRWKLFTGFVLDQPNPPQLYGISRREPVWCSEPVNFLSEWRFYVVNGEWQFFGLSDNGGDRSKEPDPDVIDMAIATYRDAPSAYAIDFGVLSSGETALIEVNDGFSVGAYDGIPASDYFTFVATRWCELSALLPPEAP